MEAYSNSVPDLKYYLTINEIFNPIRRMHSFILPPLIASQEFKHCANKKV